MYNQIPRPLPLDESSLMHKL